MSNIHGLGQLKKKRKNKQNMENGSNRPTYPQHKIPFITSISSDRQPIQQTIPYTLKLICCPDLKLCSTSFIFLVAIWIIFLICIMQGCDKNNHQILEVKYSVLLHFGSMSSFIKEGQIYRLITASFFHSNLMHIITNSISILLLCTRFEQIYRRQTPIVLLASSITGFLLSAVCKSQTLTIGASSAIFGILGGFIAYLIINWTALQPYGAVRSSLTCIICVIVFISFLFSTGKGIDAISHIGGLIGGLLISLAILPGIEYKNKMIALLGLLGVVGINVLIAFILVIA